MTIPLSTLIELHDLLAQDGINSKKLAREKIKEIIKTAQVSEDDVRELENDIVR